MQPAAARKRRARHQRCEPRDTSLPITRQDFDRENGQAYLETEVVFRGKLPVNWVRDLKTPDIVRKAKPNPRGARSLSQMATTKTVNEMSDLVSEHFEHIPWSIATRIWTEVESRHLETFYAWRLFAAQYQRSDEFGAPEKRYHLEIKQLPLQMKDYYRGLTSAHNDWHVALRISPKQNAIPDLVAVSSISNLAALDLSDGQLLLDARQPRFDERIFRTWAELAESRRAFTQLRVLMFGWQDNLSEWIFRYLNSFSSLKVVIATDCENLNQKNRSTWEATANDHGWTALHAKKSAKTLRPFLEDKCFRLGAISNLYYETKNSEEKDFNSNPVNSKDRPLVESWLGTPRMWTHIIDEFPGTRTVWLERSDSMRPPVVLAKEPAKRMRDTAHRMESCSPSSPPKPSKKTKKISRQPKYSTAKLLEEFNHSSSAKTPAHQI